MVTWGCADASADVGESMAGTAPVALTWVAVEEPGPWPRDPLDSPGLPEGLASSLRAFKKHGVGVVLIRRPEARDRAGVRRVLVARVAPGGMVLREGTTVDGADLAGWDPQRLSDGQLPPFGRPTRRGALLVCTHSKRDTCCARLGREVLQEVVREASSEERDRIWECSHLGGHRFAPVLLTLPSGVVHGRVTTLEARVLVEGMDDATVLPDRLRGRTCYPAPLQAAGAAVLRELDDPCAEAIDVLGLADGRAVPVSAGWPVPTVPTDFEVRHRDGRAWQVTVSQRTTSQIRPESCGADPLPVHAWQAGPPRAVEAWV